MVQTHVAVDVYIHQEQKLWDASLNRKHTCLDNLAKSEKFKQE